MRTFIYILTGLLSVLCLGLGLLLLFAQRWQLGGAVVLFAAVFATLGGTAWYSANYANNEAGDKASLCSELSRYSRRIGGWKGRVPYYVVLLLVSAIVVMRVLRALE